MSNPITVSDLVNAQEQLGELDWSHQGQKKYHAKEGYYYSPRLNIHVKKGMSFSLTRKVIRDAKDKQKEMVADWATNPSPF